MRTTGSALIDRPAILANSRGVLTSEQRALLRLTSGVTFWFALGSAVIVCAGVAWAAARQAADMGGRLPALPWYLPAVIVAAIGVPLVYLGWQMVRSRRIRSELSGDGVQSANASVEWTGRGYRFSGPVARLRSICEPIELTPGRYVVYVLPRSRLVLSAEPLDPPESGRAALTDVLARVLAFTLDDLRSLKERRAASDAVNVVRGVGTRSVRYRTRAAIRSISIGGERFDVNARVWAAMIEGQTYAAYYERRTRKLLAVEAVPPRTTAR